MFPTLVIIHQLFLLLGNIPQSVFDNQKNYIKNNGIGFWHGLCFI